MFSKNHEIPRVIGSMDIVQYLWFGFTLNIKKHDQAGICDNKKYNQKYVYVTLTKLLQDPLVSSKVSLFLLDRQYFLQPIKLTK